MKKIFHIVLLAFGVLGYCDTEAQNLPSTAGLPSGGGSGQIAYPYDYNQSPNVTPSGHTYLRTVYPQRPMTSLPANLFTGNMIYNTTYLDGWGNALMSINNNGTGQAIVQPFDHREWDTSVNYLPFYTYSTGDFINNPFALQKNFYSTQFPAEHDNAYSAGSYASVSGVPTTKSFLPGRAMVGEPRGVTSTSGFNAANEIYIITYNSGTVCKSGYYAANKLVVAESDGQHSQSVKTYTDMDGKLICRKVFAGGSTWLTTYYVYNDLDQLVCIVPPKAADQFASNTCLSNVNDLCFQYTYDTYGNVVNKRVPGRSDTDIVIYNKYFQSVLFQTPGLRDSGRLRFVIYDKRGRTAMTGIYTGSETISYWRGVAAGTTTPVTHYVSGNPVTATGTLEYWITNCFSGYTYPASLYGCDIYSYNYYDDYSNSPVSSSFNSGYSALYQTAAYYAETPTPFLNVQGKLVASKVKILDRGAINNFTNTWMTNLYFYDEKGRLIQQQTQNPWSKWDTVTLQYNFANQLVRKIASYHLWNGANKPNTRIVTGYNYDLITTRLLDVRQKIDTFAWYYVASYTYDNFGRVTKQTLCETEDQNFTYNVRGQLIGINAADLRDATLPDHMTYLSELNYETGFDHPRYDGSLSGYKWRSSSSEVRAYGYLYDAAGRLTDATYRDSSAVGPGAPTWNNANRDFTVSNLTYDLNGNILTMNQRGYDTLLQPANIDLLGYTYDNGNRLQKVTDGGVKSPVSDFDNGSSGTGNDYTYDHNGNLISDANKAIALQYDDLDMPTKVKTGTDSIENIYDAGGVILQKRIREGGDSTVYRYWGPLVLNNDSLQYVMHPEGRYRWLKDSLYFKTDVFARDHQGNVRTVQTAETRTALAFHAGFEMVAANIEEAMFSGIQTIRDNNPSGTPEDLMSGQLDGTTNQIGTAILVHVMAGDQLDLQSYGYYETGDTNAFNTYATASTMAGALLSTLTTGTLTGGEGGTISSTTVSNLLGAENYAIYDAMKDSITDRNYPRVYLNYLSFDESFNILPEECSITQMKGPDHVWNMLTQPGYICRKNGYVLAYVSNESDVVTFIDNTTFTIHYGQLQQEQHYYPHGLVLDAGLATGALKSNYLFEGNELQPHLNLQLSDFNYRQYDQQIGRFTSVDPLADASGQEIYSPYHFVGNDPANYTDPLGLNPNKKERRALRQQRCERSNVVSQRGGDGSDGTDIWAAIGDFFGSLFGGGDESSGTDGGGGGEADAGPAAPASTGSGGGGGSDGGSASSAAVGSASRGGGFAPSTDFARRHIQEDIADRMNKYKEGQASHYAGSSRGYGWGAIQQIAANSASRPAMTSKQVRSSLQRRFHDNLDLARRRGVKHVIAGEPPALGFSSVLGDIRTLYYGVTVLGHFPEYVNLAKELDGRFFEIPPDIWNTMSDAEQWAANKRFLDRAISRGDIFRLATPINEVRPGSYFQRELNYLFDRGYKLSPDGHWLIR